MSFQSATSTFFIPGNPALTPDERKHHFGQFPDLKKLEGGVFSHEGLATNYYVSRAHGREKLIIIGFSGANAQFPLNYPEIAALNRYGITMICMALPHMGEKFMERSENLARAFLTSSRSPANFLITGDAPQAIVTHSSSGPIIVKLFGEEDTGAKLRHRFDDFVLLSPLWDTPYSSRHHSIGFGPVKFGPLTIPAIHTPPLSLGRFRIPSFGMGETTIGPVEIPEFRPLARVFEHYADANADKRFNDLHVVKLYLTATASDRHYSDNSVTQNLTMGNIRGIQKYARAAADNFDPKHLAGVDTILMAGDKDSCTSWRASRAMAERMGAEFLLVQGGNHDLLKERRAPLMVLMDHAEKVICLRESYKRATTYISDTGHIPEETIPLPPPPLRHRMRALRDSAGDALQRGASFLNPVAGLF